MVSTACAGLAPTFPALIAARAMAGFFGGPATSLSMSIVADAVPSEADAAARSRSPWLLASMPRRPRGLSRDRWAGWRAPFFAIAALGFVAVAVTRCLPPHHQPDLVVALRTSAPAKA